MWCLENPIRVLRKLGATTLAAMVPGLLSTTPGISEGPQLTSKDLFGSCVGCHFVPRLELATDRAWINGIRQTG